MATSRSSSDEMQIRTFTNWCNSHLESDQAIQEFPDDLSDGVRLFAMVQSLLGRNLGKRPRRTSNVFQCRASIHSVLEVLRMEGFDLTNIGAEDIVDKNEKLILGLIWRLILHFSVTVNIDKDDAPEPSAKGGKRKDPTKKLLKWIQDIIPALKICNFTTDWNNGKAVGALVNALAPGSIPGWDNDSGALDKITDAMNKAEKELNILQLIDPDDMADPEVDDRSMITYLAQFVMFGRNISKYESLVQYITSDSCNLSFKGGNLLLPEIKAKLEIPEYALPEDKTEKVKISLNRDHSNLPPIEDDHMMMTPVIHCEPDGMTFNKPVTLSLPHSGEFDPRETDINDIQLWHKSNKEGEWEELPSEYSPGTKQVGRVKKITEEEVTIEVVKFCLFTTLFKKPYKMKILMFRDPPQLTPSTDCVYITAFAVKACLKKVVTAICQDNSRKTCAREKQLLVKPNKKDLTIKMKIAESVKGWKLDNEQEIIPYEYLQFGDEISNCTWCIRKSGRGFDGSTNLKLSYDAEQEMKVKDYFEINMSENKKDSKSPEDVLPWTDKIDSPTDHEEMKNELERFMNIGIRLEIMQKILAQASTILCGDRDKSLKITPEQVKNLTRKMHAMEAVGHHDVELILNEYYNPTTNHKVEEIRKAIHTKPVTAYYSFMKALYGERDDLYSKVREEQSRICREHAEKHGGQTKQPELVGDVPKAPGKPRQVNEFIDKTSLKISWSPPESDVSSLDIGYFVETWFATSQKWIKVNEEKLRVTSFIIKDLHSGQHQFRVLAENAAGSNEPSEVLSTRTWDHKPGVPGKPKVEGFGGVAVKITWSPPEDASLVAGYVIEKMIFEKHVERPKLLGRLRREKEKVEYLPQSSEWIKVQDKLSDTHYITGADVNHKYAHKFCVSAQNPLGISEPSEPSEFCYIGEWEKTGVVGDGRLSQPWGIALINDHTMAVADYGANRVCIFSTGDEYKYECDTTTHTLNTPWGVVYISGRLYVTDLSAFVTSFNGDNGEYIDRWLSLDTKYGQTSNDAELCGICVYQSFIMVGSKYGNYVSKHELDGRHVGSFKVDIAPYYMAATSDGNVIISDEIRVQIVNETGHVLHRLQHADMSKPSGMFCCSGVVYVCDEDQAKVFCFNEHTGEYITFITIDEKQPGDLYRGSEGIVLDGKEQTLYVTRGWNGSTGRVEVYTRTK